MLIVASAHGMNTATGLCIVGGCNGESLPRRLQNIAEDIKLELMEALTNIMNKRDEQGNLVLSPLPHMDDYLEPFISEKTIRYHYWKHLKTYIDNVNALSKYKNPPTLENMLQSSQWTNPNLFQNALQVFNHYFYFEALNKMGESLPYGNTLGLIKSSFRDFETFKTKFTAVSKSVFGSGWVWLIQRRDGVVIVPTIGAGITFRHDENPLLCLDMWEHAYYLDYKNDKTAYIEAFFNLVDWSVVEKRVKIW